MTSSILRIQSKLYSTSPPNQHHSFLLLHLRAHCDTTFHPSHGPAILSFLVLQQAQNLSGLRRWCCFFLLGMLFSQIFRQVTLVIQAAAQMSFSEEVFPSPLYLILPPSHYYIVLFYFQIFFYFHNRNNLCLLVSAYLFPLEC